MARFLTSEWLNELGSALEAQNGRADDDEGRVGGDELSVRQVVTGGPNGDTSFVIRAGTTGVVLDLRADGPADIEVHQDFATAVEIATGRLTPSAAFAAGRVKLTGRVGLLVERQRLLGAVGDPFVLLRAATTY